MRYYIPALVPKTLICVKMQVFYLLCLICYDRNVFCMYKCPESHTRVLEAVFA
jgi:hypothetical protein